MTIDTSKLAREIKDRLDLKTDSDNTFYRATEEDYTEELMAVLIERGKPNSNHSFISSVTGQQGCHLKGTKIFIKRGDLFKLINIENVLVGDEVCSLDKEGSFAYGKVVNNWKYENSPVLKISMKGGNELNVTKNHKLFTLRNGDLNYIEAGSLRESDLILRWSPEDEVAESPEENSEYYFGVLHGAYIADGSGEGNISKEDDDVADYLINCGLKCGVNVTKRKLGVGVPKWVNLLSLGKRSNKFLRDFHSASFLKGVLDGYILCDSGLNLCAHGVKSKLEVKFISKSEEWINQLQFLLLFFYGVNSWKKIRVLRSGNWKGNVYFSLTFSSEDAIKLLNSFEFVGNKKTQKNYILKKHYFQKDARSNYKLLPVEKDFFKLGGTGFYKRGSKLRDVCKLLNRCLREGYFQKMAVRKWLSDFPVLEPYLGKYVDLFRFYSAEKVESVVEFKGDVFDIEVEKYHKYMLGNGLISSNSGKSYLSIALCKILDPDFSVDNIFFDYRDLIYNRSKLKPGTAVLVDEQSEEYGLDSHRINIVLAALKEQLRKKSIHFIFCSPTLKDEYHSSHYVIETLYIDYEEEVCYAAYKTRELLTLGYVKVPHPLNFVTKEFLEEYEAKKDKHLDELTGMTQVDEIEDIASKIIENDLFKRAELFYRKKIGYIPGSMVVQVINKLYPEFKSSIIVGEVAARIKLNKELDGTWKIPYSDGKKSKKK